MVATKVVLVAAGITAIGCGVMGAITYLAGRAEAKGFNNGTCSDCGTDLRRFDVDSYGNRGYVCDNCGKTTWVSYKWVDALYED